MEGTFIEPLIDVLRAILEPAEKTECIDTTTIQQNLPPGLTCDGSYIDRCLRSLYNITTKRISDANTKYYGLSLRRTVPQTLPDRLSATVLKFCRENFRETKSLSVHGNITVVTDTDTTVAFFSKKLLCQQDEDIEIMGSTDGEDSNLSFSTRMQKRARSSDVAATTFEPGHFTTTTTPSSEIVKNNLRTHVNSKRSQQNASASSQMPVNPGVDASPRSAQLYARALRKQQQHVQQQSEQFPSRPTVETNVDENAFAIHQEGSMLSFADIKTEPPFYQESINDNSYSSRTSLTSASHGGLGDFTTAPHDVSGGGAFPYESHRVPPGVAGGQGDGTGMMPAWNTPGRPDYMEQEYEHQQQQETTPKRGSQDGNKNADGTTPKRRPGRPHGDIWMANLFLLNRPIFCLKDVDLKKLQVQGFGSPTFGPTPISRSWKISDLEKFIIKSFPNKPLEEVGFTFYRCAKGGGRLMEPLNATSIIELSKKVSAGRVFIVPLNPIPFDATAEDNREKEEEKQKEAPPGGESVNQEEEESQVARISPLEPEDQQEDSRGPTGTEDQSSSASFHQEFFAQCLT